MVSFCHTNRASEVNMLPTLALVTLLLKGAVGFDIVVFSIIFTEAFELLKRAREGLAQVAAPQPSSAGP